MKHLLSIITLLGIVSLIFVSCTKSPEQYVENCADTNFIDRLEKQEAALYSNEYFSLEAKNELSYRNEIKFVKQKSLQAKLRKDDWKIQWRGVGSAKWSYEDAFDVCLDDMNYNEVLFKAKWK